MSDDEGEGSSSHEVEPEPATVAPRDPLPGLRADLRIAPGDVKGLLKTLCHRHAPPQGNDATSRALTRTERVGKVRVCACALCRTVCAGVAAVCVCAVAGQRRAVRVHRIAAMHRPVLCDVPSLIVPLRLRVTS